MDEYIAAHLIGRHWFFLCVCVCLNEDSEVWKNLVTCSRSYKLLLVELGL